jgi:hypothetical protein
MLEAARWLGGRKGWDRALIVTDSLSLVDAIQGDQQQPNVDRLQGVLWALHDRGRQVEVMWAPGHCGLEGNDRADGMARRGGREEQGGVTLDRNTREAYIRREVGGGVREIVHDRIRRTYRGPVREVEERVLSRGDRVDLARFRAGHHPDVRRWKVMIGETGETGCRLCGKGEETCEHLWVECEALEALRHRYELGRDLAELVERPVPAMALLSALLRRLR